TRRSSDLEPIENLTAFERTPAELIEYLSDSGISINRCESCAFFVAQLLLLREIVDCHIIPEKHIAKIKTVFDQAPLIHPSEALHHEPRCSQTKPCARVIRVGCALPLTEAKPPFAPANNLINKL